MHFVGLYYKNISQNTVLCMSDSLIKFAITWYSSSAGDSEMLLGMCEC
jgi:hypothetical protein